MSPAVRSGIVNLWQREDGFLSPRCFASRIGASEGLVMRLGIHKKLDKHGGCVNTVSFNSDGTVLVSGSDDQMIMLWNWDSATVKLSFHSGHSNNVFQARFMPYTDDRTLVTCAADGEVRHAKILEGGKVETVLLAEHEGRAHKLAVEPGSPYIFYSCGEDGLVQHFDLRTRTATKLLTCKSEQGRVVLLNAITIDPTDPNLFAVGGMDEYARVYDIRRYKWDGSTDIGRPAGCYYPSHLIGKDHVSITGLKFSDQGELLISYNDENIYLFKKEHELDNGGPESDGPQVYQGHRNCETVKGVSFIGPRCEYVASGSDCGRVFIWRKKDGKLLRAMEGDKYVVNCIESHPHALVIASSGIENDVKIWIPNLTEPEPPVNVAELKPRKRENRLWRFGFREDVITQVLALQRRGAALGEDSEGSSASNADLVNFIVRLANGDDSSDESSGESSGRPGDCMVN